jgi:hypothetical protein
LSSKGEALIAPLEFRATLGDDWAMGALVAGILLISLILPGLAHAQVYRWVDKDGVVNYTTGLDSVPERYRPHARPFSLPSSPPSTAADEPRRSTPAATKIPFTPGIPILVSAKINGLGPVTLILDTGADRTIVAPGALSRLGISTVGASRAELKGVTGSSQVDVVGVTSLEVGEAKAGPLLIVAHDAELKHADGLLGRDFLDNFTVTIDSQGRTVTLAPR